jgi:hypothetical protein
MSGDSGGERDSSAGGPKIQSRLSGRRLSSPRAATGSQAPGHGRPGVLGSALVRGSATAATPTGQDHEFSGMDRDEVVAVIRAERSGHTDREMKMLQEIQAYKEQSRNFSTQLWLLASECLRADPRLLDRLVREYGSGDYVSRDKYNRLKARVREATEARDESLGGEAGVGRPAESPRIRENGNQSHRPSAKTGVTAGRPASLPRSVSSGARTLGRLVGSAGLAFTAGSPSSTVRTDELQRPTSARSSRNSSGPGTPARPSSLLSPRTPDSMVQRTSLSLSARLGTAALHGALGGGRPLPQPPPRTSQRFTLTAPPRPARRPSDRLTRHVRAWTVDATVVGVHLDLLDPTKTPSETPGPAYTETGRRVVLAQAGVRRWLVRRRYARDLLRAQITTEILETERTYVRSLRWTVEFVLRPLEAAVGTDREIISLADIRQIFSQIKALSLTNQGFLAELEAAEPFTSTDSGSRHRRIGAVFTEYADHMRCYGDYVNNFSAGSSRVQELVASRKQFRRFLDGVTRDNCGQTLGSLLIKPVQRIPRYAMLLQELLKSTDDPSRLTAAGLEDRVDLETGWTKMVGLNKRMNAQGHESEAAARFLQITQAFPTVGTAPEISELFQPHRRLVHEGSVCHHEILDPSSVDRASRVPSPTYAILLNDAFLVVGRTANGSRELLDPRAYVDVGTIRETRALGPEESVTGGARSWFLVTSTERSFVLSAEDQAGRDTWVSRLRTVCTEWKNARQSFSADPEK